MYTCMCTCVLWGSPQDKIIIFQGIIGRHGLTMGCMGLACSHVKAFSLFPFTHQRKLCTEGLAGADMT